MSLLEEIVQRQRTLLRQKKQNVSLKNLQQKLAETPPDQRSLLQRLKNEHRFHFVCEIKRKSPSAGELNNALDPAQQALAYEFGGASAISVLTEPYYFNGQIEDLKLVKKATSLPVLRKDFIIDPYQVWEAAAYGADIILLIARILSAEALLNLTLLAANLQMEILIELHAEEEISKLPRELDRLPVILGINNRNLDTLHIDLGQSLRLKPLIPPDIPVISESGVRNAQQCKLLKENGFNGVLMGEGILKHSQPQQFLKDLIREVNV